MNLVVDGSTHPDPKQAIFESDPTLGIYPPFVVFDTDIQGIVSPNFSTRLQAEMWKDGMERSQRGNP